MNIIKKTTLQLKYNRIKAEYDLYSNVVLPNLKRQLESNSPGMRSKEYITNEIAIIENRQLPNLKDSLERIKAILKKEGILFD